MPIIKTIDGIEIHMYFHDHNPPHFHIIYNEYEELVEIESLRTYKGEVPGKVRKKVIAWAETRLDFLRSKWDEFS